MLTDFNKGWTAALLSDNAPDSEICVTCGCGVRLDDLSDREGTCGACATRNRNEKRSVVAELRTVLTLHPGDIVRTRTGSGEVVDYTVECVTGVDEHTVHVETAGPKPMSTTHYYRRTDEVAVHIRS